MKKLVCYCDKIQFKVIAWPWSNTVTLNKSIVKSPAVHSRGWMINDGLKSHCPCFQRTESASR